MEAIQFIETIERLPSVDSVLDQIGRTFAGYGFDYFCLCGFPRPQQKFEQVTLAIRVPAEWLQLYHAENYAQVDPTMRHCTRTTQPFEWKDAPYDASREPRAAEMIQRATDFGLSEGIWVPIPSLSGCLGGVWMGGAKPDLSIQTKPLLHLMALYAFDRIRRLRSPNLTPRPAVTPREREVLAWAAQGKSAWEMGQILMIAERTVNEHLQTAFQKLGAVNRTHAVAIALRERLIDG